MALLIVIDDIKTHIYSELVNEITRDDEEIIQEAINAAIDEAKGYLDKYDLVKLFGTETVDPVILDSNLKSKVKDLVKWNLIKLGNRNIDFDVTERQYEHAIKLYFQAIWAGKVQPPGWPYKDYATEPELPQGNSVTWDSNPKRGNHF